MVGATAAFYSGSMNLDRDVSLLEAWQKMPAKRRHLYFFTLLALATFLTAHFQENMAAFRRLIPPPPMPPRITSREVYPAPVTL
ncbi:MAG: hypothetical protein QOF48_1337 [Verrucomicrobiota bacterium]|jgi:hypothetical protein